jgi:ribose-phosphate pyrophosphokinase
MIWFDTAGTLCKAAEVIMANGAKSVRAVITHGICSGAALARD